MRDFPEARTKDDGGGSQYAPLPSDLRSPLRAALEACGQYGAGQTAGRFYPIACVALEVTQRCNLDCTLCYLSDSAEMAFDVPLTVLYRRIDMIRNHYGLQASVQITGGDPTLRKVEDLQAICAYIRKMGLRSCLMTNGIRASRSMLQALAETGLDDVAFHVDLTQERKGYPTEKSLNTVRHDYIQRCEGLGLRVLFNTTVFDGNFAELPDLALFFRREASKIRLAGFNLQAETGRGIEGARTETLTINNVAAGLEAGMGTEIDFDVGKVGHESCTRYGSLLIAGDAAISALANRKLFEDILDKMDQHEVSQDAITEIQPTLRRVYSRSVGLALRSAAFLLGRLWHLRGGLLESRGRVHSLTLLIHNFMDAKELDEERCASCVFMVATENGPTSMCVHNAQRDQNVFAPAKVGTADDPKWWHPSTGQISTSNVPTAHTKMPFKRLKGRLRHGALIQIADRAEKL